MSRSEVTSAMTEALTAYDRLDRALDDTAFQFECAGHDVRATAFMDARDELAEWFKAHLSAEFDEEER